MDRMADALAICRAHGGSQLARRLVDVHDVFDAKILEVGCLLWRAAKHHYCGASRRHVAVLWLVLRRFAAR